MEEICTILEIYKLRNHFSLKKSAPGLPRQSTLFHWPSQILLLWILQESINLVIGGLEDGESIKSIQNTEFKPFSMIFHVFVLNPTKITVI